MLRRYQGKFFQAITYQEQALALLEQDNEQEGGANILTNLGVVYGELGKFDEAEDVLREALHVDEMQDFILFNLALVLRQKYQDTQCLTVRNEVVTLLNRYLRLEPSDDAAREYLRELTSLEFL
ncbi:hypothetical protein CSA56_10400 [candidate division KSB3 bacterium]|uniref:Uncharacterized protein n=1 Tax=candidate division KSB3 bacterium TaxID=2044937 RepID=A0A2G6KDI1_9BACT|nr:MAG: hypothetical protein CSA56_10400 [candidate division KSB3 bacterium]